MKPSRKKRSESFFGVHFDFHASLKTPNIGKRTSPDMIEKMLNAAKPDYVQCDCKGHPGFASYPTNVGTPAPEQGRDSLRIWRDVTERRGVSLYMHYSGVIDKQALKQNPEWARVDEQGQPDTESTSTFGPYVDKLMIPQLKELIDEYSVDGVWVDGECWGAKPDYSPAALETFIRETGIEEVPESPDAPAYFEFLEFNREAFRRYLRHYVDELHQYCPDFELASNWAFSSFMPEPVSADVDFVSGDFILQNSVNNARLEARCLVRQGKPWDIMAWSFSMTFGQVPGQYREKARCAKTAIQLQQEAAIVLALGGGFQVYCPQAKDGAIIEWQLPIIEEVAEFCRKRETFCHRSMPVPQIGLIFSTTSFYRQNSRLFSPWGIDLNPLQGILQCLLEGQNSVEVLMKHQLAGRMADYPLLVFPEWSDLKDSFKKELLEYVENGGNLLIIGSEAAASFEEELEVEWRGDLKTDAVQYLEFEGGLTGLQTPSRDVEIGLRARSFGRLFSANEPTGDWRPAASVVDYGKGRLAAVYFNFGERYCNGATTIARDFLQGLVRELFPEPLVEIDGSHNVEVTVMEKDNRLLINLINTAGPHSDKKRYVFDEIPAIGPLQITIRQKNRPQSLYLQPENKALSFEYTEGLVKLSIESLTIHRILVLET